MDAAVAEMDNRISKGLDIIMELSGRNKARAGPVVSYMTEQEQGKKVFECISELSELDPEGLPQFPSIRSMIYREMFLAYRNEDNCSTMCAYCAKEVKRRQEQKIAGGSRNLRGLGAALPDDASASEDKDGGSKQLSSKQTSATANDAETNLDKLVSHLSHEQQGHRKLGTPAIPLYPSVVSSAYATWAGSNVAQFVSGGDLTKRADPTLLVNDIFVPRSIASTALATLEGAASALEIVCNAFGTVELVFGPGDACRIASQSVAFTAAIQENVVNALTGDFEDWKFHNSLIDAAEIQATNKDAAALVTALI